MDTSRKYIQMCEKAAEIQLLCPIKLQGHHYRFEDCIHILEGEYYWLEIEKNNKKIWLPRQDQLQDMLDYSAFSSKTFIQAYLINQYAETFCIPDKDNNFPFNSMEQLWLAFVMKEKYNKTWNGSDWKEGE